MRIDVHAHYLSKEYLDLLDGLGGIEPGTETGRPIVYPGLSADLDARFSVMERAGVGLQILSVSGLMPYFSDAGKGIQGARYANDMYAELVRAHPGKFAAFAALPLPHVDASLAELRRALDELGMVGVTFATSVLGHNLGDRCFDPIYEELNRRAAVLFIHPAGLACGSAPIKEAGLLWPLGGTAEDTLCAVHMMTAGFTERFPKIRTILPHLGGTLPLLMHRLDRPLRASLPDKQPLETISRKFWYDTVNGYPPALRCACEAYGADRLVFGTDYPFFRDDAYVRAATYIEETGLSAADTEAIFSGNALRLFNEIELPV
jgi:predicted TIM-barrel fold metal-dependent hydrolase